VTGRVVDDASDFADVPHRVVEEDEVHRDVRLVVVLEGRVQCASQLFLLNLRFGSPR
jgi:hypothetical protein